MTNPSNNPPTSNHEIWLSAIQWVNANRNLICQIASPYSKYMVADKDDLFQEATIAAFKALIVTRKKQAPHRFMSFFRVIFKTNCIKLSTGIPTIHALEDYLADSIQEEEPIAPETHQIEQALQGVSKRQHEVCTWILRQPDPVGTPELALHFKVSRRHACRLIQNSIQRITEAA
jgi:DNA-directed RNA polymerase specialized sigma24 family protein